MERIRQNYKQTDLKTLIEGRKYWVNNGHWTFRFVGHLPTGILICMDISPRTNTIIPYDSFFDLTLLPLK